jgi:glucosamine--fructose-6-phosphate aminotransferase (isomerizing)
VTVPDGRLAAEGEPEDLYTPIPFIVPAQLFAAWLAAHKRLDPDAPPGLRKVTKTM